MSRKHYIITLVLIGFYYLLNIPYAFLDIPFFSELKEKYPLSLFYAAMIGAIFYWVPVLIYFKQKKWRFSFITGIVLMFTATLLSFFIEYGNENDQTILIATGIVSLFYLASQTLYGISFLSSNHMRGLSFIRAYGIVTFFSIMVVFLSPIIEAHNISYVTGTLWTMETVVFTLHLVYERNKLPKNQIAEEILDMNEI